MAAAASMPAAAVACLLLSALAVVSATATFPAPAPAPQEAVAVDPPHQEGVAANPCGDIFCVQANGGNPQGGAHVASLACPGEGGHGVVCCCCPLGFGGSGRCCSPRYCRKAPSPPAVSA
ncbi:unnamed protein product [Urochloa decumbens]|uniref:Uncharacterized protein n=1 Tax=Urochloa decumbens TaxID=240449 RepID=A0ABC9EHF4_9POAL